MRVFVFFCLASWLGISHAAIVDLGNITRDTSTGLDWLDVTATQGLSYNQVLAELAPGGSLEGYRYATTAEVDQLITNFGYIPRQTCDYGLINCDLNVSDSEITEVIIRTLGDTYDAWADANSWKWDVASSGAGFTSGLVGDTPREDGDIGYAYIYDYEIFLRGTDDPPELINDYVASAYGRIDYQFDDSNELMGSFLVAPTVVPLPAAAWMFGSALLGLGFLRRNAKKKIL